MPPRMAQKMAHKLVLHASNKMVRVTAGPEAADRLAERDRGGRQPQAGWQFNSIKKGPECKQKVGGRILRFLTNHCQRSFILLDPAYNPHDFQHYHYQRLPGVHGHRAALLSSQRASTGLCPQADPASSSKGTRTNCFPELVNGQVIKFGDLNHNS